MDVRWIQSLIENAEPENQRLDYKSRLPDKSSGGQQEFASDLSAFANGEGGRLVYGILEDGEGCASSIAPIEGDIEAETQRLQSYAADKVCPRIQGIKVHPIRTRKLRYERC